MPEAKRPVHNRERRASSAATADGDVPAGDLPPQPRWPLVVASAAWGLWIVFLVVMMWMRIRTTAV